MLSVLFFTQIFMENDNVLFVLAMESVTIVIALGFVQIPNLEL